MTNMQRDQAGAARWGGYPCNTQAGYNAHAKDGSNRYMRSALIGGAPGLPYPTNPPPNMNVPSPAMENIHDNVPVPYVSAEVNSSVKVNAGTYAGFKVEIKQCDMTQEMANYAIEVSAMALEKYGTDKNSKEKETAAMIKEAFDYKYNGNYHCIIGRNFGSLVTSERGHFIYFYMGPKNILLFGTGCSVVLLSKLLFNGSSSIIAGEGASQQEVSKIELLSQENLKKEIALKERDDFIKRLHMERESYAMEKEKQAKADAEEAKSNYLARIKTLEETIGTITARNHELYQIAMATKEQRIPEYQYRMRPDSEYVHPNRHMDELDMHPYRSSPGMNSILSPEHTDLVHNQVNIGTSLVSNPHAQAIAHAQYLARSKKERQTEQLEESQTYEAQMEAVQRAVMEAQRANETIHARGQSPVTIQLPQTPREFASIFMKKESENSTKEINIFSSMPKFHSPNSGISENSEDTSEEALRETLTKELSIHAAKYGVTVDLTRCSSSNSSSTKTSVNEYSLSSSGKTFSTGNFFEKTKNTSETVSESDNIVIPDKEDHSIVQAVAQAKREWESEYFLNFPNF